MPHTSLCACHTSLQGQQSMSRKGGGLWRGREGTGWLTVALEPGTLRPAPNSLMMIPDLRRARPPPPGALGLSGPPDGPACTYTYCQCHFCCARQHFRQSPALWNAKALSCNNTDIKISRSATEHPAQDIPQRYSSRDSAAASN